VVLTLFLVIVELDAAGRMHPTARVAVEAFHAR
jgi:hypothetical protein